MINLIFIIIVLYLLLIIVGMVAAWLVYRYRKIAKGWESQYNALRAILNRYETEAVDKALADKATANKAIADKALKEAKKTAAAKDKGGVK